MNIHICISKDTIIDAYIHVYMNFHIHAYGNKYSHTHLNKHPLCISNFAVFFQNDSLQKNNTDKIYMQVQFISK